MFFRCVWWNQYEIESVQSGVTGAKDPTISKQSIRLGRQALIFRAGNRRFRGNRWCHLRGKWCNPILIFCLFIFFTANSCLIHFHPYFSNSGGSDLPWWFFTSFRRQGRELWATNPSTNREEGSSNGLPFCFVGAGRRPQQKKINK